jgi:hypothetical protein
MQNRYETNRIDAAEYRKRILAEVNELVKSDDWEKYSTRSLCSVLIALKGEINVGEVVV